MTLLSPGVEVKEIDLTTIIPAASAVDGAFVGRFAWGTCYEPVLVGTEDDLVANFYQPVYPSSFSTQLNGAYSQDFLVAAQFLSYASRLRAVRAVVKAGGAGTAAFNSNASVTGAAGTAIQVLNKADFDSKAGSLSSYFLLGRYPGILGNSIGVSVCRYSAAGTEWQNVVQAGTATGWTFNRSVAASGITGYTNPNGYVNVPVLTAPATQAANFNVGDYVSFTYAGKVYKNKIEEIANSGVSIVLAKSSLVAPTVSTTLASGSLSNITMNWAFSGLFTAAPASGQVHLVLYDATGAWSGTAGTILASYRNLDLTNANATYDDGSTSYLPKVLNDGSLYVRAGEGVLTLPSVDTKALTFTMAGGTDGDVPGVDEIITGWDQFSNPAQTDISLCITGVSDSSAIIPNYVIDNICETRKDCIAFVSPRQSDVVNATGSELTNVKTFRNLLPSTSFAFLDSGWKYIFDRYNNTYRWIPLNADMAGLTARTETERDAWFPPAGFNRGGLKNIVKLAWNPSQVQRDDLYSANVNPVLNFDGQGTVLFGDKTLLTKSSAFDRINVRRLFIILEKAIKKASVYSLFELNDEYTRQRFVGLVEPFLREIQGRRGITDFLIVCDETNNTPQVVDTNRFIGDIYIKPARSINFITLNFIAVPTGVDFNEVVGKF